MNPNVWGKYQWTSIHFVALGYPTASPPDDVKESYRRYFTEILPEVLPCYTCREHLKKTLVEQHPLLPQHLENSETLFAWTVSLHNVVNARLGKKQLTLEEAKKIYMYEDNLQKEICKDHNESPQQTVVNIVPNTPDTNVVKTIETNQSNWKLLFLLILLIITLIIVNMYYFIILKGCGSSILRRFKK